MSLNKFKIKNKIYNNYEKILVIGEIGSNHDNNFNKCKKLIIEAKKAGCDAVKFQLFKSHKLLEKKHPAQKILKKYELNTQWLKRIKKLCNQNELHFICSPFYTEAVKLLKKSGCDAIKIASPEIKNFTLLKEVYKSKLPVIISTGDTDLKIIERALNIFKKQNDNKKAILHCISQYPTKEENINLNNIPLLKKKFNKISIGFSDHTIGKNAALLAVGLGANIIEKHITLNKKSIGPDHAISMEIPKLKNLIKEIRQFSKMFGKKNKIRHKFENTVYINIFTINSQKKGTKLKSFNLVCKRDFKRKIDSFKLPLVINRVLLRDVPGDYPLNWNDIKK